MRALGAPSGRESPSARTGPGEPGVHGAGGQAGCRRAGEESRGRRVTSGARWQAPGEAPPDAHPVPELQAGQSGAGRTPGPRRARRRRASRPLSVCKPPSGRRRVRARRCLSAAPPTLPAGGNLVAVGVASPVCGGLVVSLPVPAPVGVQPRDSSPFSLFRLLRLSRVWPHRGLHHPVPSCVCIIMAEAWGPSLGYRAPPPQGQAAGTWRPGPWVQGWT